MRICIARSARRHRSDVILLRRRTGSAATRSMLSGSGRASASAAPADHPVGEGEISNLHIGLKGTMNTLFLKDLAAKTHRDVPGSGWGLASQAAASATAEMLSATSTSGVSRSGRPPDQ